MHKHVETPVETSAENAVVSTTASPFESTIQKLGEILIALTEKLGINAPGTKAVFYGVILMAIIYVVPTGVWPWIARRLGFAERRP